MTIRPDVSVIICTRNNAESLVETLRAFGRIKMPEALNIELIVVDNASSDGTACVVREADPSLGAKYLYAPIKGLSRARNAGLNAAKGEIILFTDDDVIPCADWIEIMVYPLLNRQCDAITGRIQLAKHLVRPWMQPMHFVWLAAAPLVMPELVGACMGFRRSVLEKVPEFDTELGAGALGFAEETLFSDQLGVAGYSLQIIDQPCVEHHPRTSRLVRKEWLKTAKKRGRSHAYVLHHWEHRELKFPILCSHYHQLKLLLRRIIQPPQGLDEEGAPAWEISYIVELEKYRGFIVERFRPRNYDKRGLRKKI